MKYNFDQLVERRGTGCVKWDEMSSPDIMSMGFGNSLGFDMFSLLLE